MKLCESKHDGAGKIVWDETVQAQCPFCELLAVHADVLGDIDTWRSDARELLTQLVELGEPDG